MFGEIKVVYPFYLFNYITHLPCINIFHTKYAFAKEHNPACNVFILQVVFVSPLRR